MLTFDLDYSDYITMLCEINGVKRKCSYLVDTQADISVFKYSSIPGTPYFDETNVINIKGITHDSLKSLGTIHVGLYTEQDVIDHEFHVVPDEFNIDSDGIIGKDFLAFYRCKIDYEDMTFTINNRYSNIFRLTHGPDELTMTVPPRSEVVRKFTIVGEQECVVDQIMLAPGVYTARTIVSPHEAYIRVINTTDRPQKVGKAIRETELLTNFEIYQADAVVEDAKRIEQLRKIIQKNVPSQFFFFFFNIWFIGITKSYKIWQ